MNRNLLIVILAAAVAVAALFIWHGRAEDRTPCTQEARICPDGSAVGRTGPDCEFAACPETGTIGENGSGIRGTVLLGPNCPVVRVPPDDKCADKPYSVSLEVTEAASGRPVKTFQSDEQGRFSVALPAGEYVIRGADSSKPFPRCSSPGPFTVRTGSFTEVAVSCDTGIR